MESHQRALSIKDDSGHCGEKELKGQSRRKETFQEALH
jgi:hypothetical protein